MHLAGLILFGLGVALLVFLVYADTSAVLGHALILVGALLGFATWWGRILAFVLGNAGGVAVGLALRRWGLRRR